MTSQAPHGAATCPLCGRLVALDSQGRYSAHSARRSKPGAHSMRVNGTQPMPQRSRLKVCSNTGRLAASERAIGLVKAVVLSAICTELAQGTDMQATSLENMRNALLAICLEYPEILEGTSLTVAMIDPGDTLADAATIL